MKQYLYCFLAIFLTTVATAQDTENPYDGRVNAVFTSIPLLRANPDARSGGMGDLGIASEADAASIYWNTAKLAFVEKDQGFTTTYTPWLRNLINDMFIMYVSYYKRIDELQTVGVSMRYFSLGDITFTNINGQENGSFNPSEIAIDAAYGRKLGENFSIGLNLKYFNSSLANGQITDQGDEVTAAQGVAADLSMFYQKKGTFKGLPSQLRWGVALTNFGNKVSYSKETSVKDFIPINLGAGIGYSIEIDDFNRIMIVGEMNRLLVPTPIIDPDRDNDGAIDDQFDEDNNNIVDYREKTLLSGMFGSFSDAEGGFTEEMREIMWAVGLEYWYNNQFALRMGHFNEHELKGDRKYMTFGLGLKYNVFGLDFSYLVPVSQLGQHPLKNTLRFSLSFDLDKNSPST